MLLVRDLMTRSVVSVPPDASVDDVRVAMDRHGFRHMPLVDEAGRVTGLISDRDLVARALAPLRRLPPVARRARLRSAPASAIATSDVVTISPDASAAVAGASMRDDGMGCLPVVEHGRIVGMLSPIDFVKHVMGVEERKSRAARVGDLMTAPVISLSPEDCVATAMEQMRQHRIHHVPVTAPARVLRGIVSARDVAKRAMAPLCELDEASRDKALHELRLSEVMTAVLHTVGAKDSICRAGELLRRHQYSSLPVVGFSGFLVGIVTESDFVDRVVHQAEAGEAMGWSVDAQHGGGVHRAAGARRHAAR